ncbi:MAG: hypothetical protein ACHQ4F_10235 [Candidatus Dormibacteria bacterium]
MGAFVVIFLAGCGGTVSGTGTPSTNGNYIQQYANAGAALDTATTTWDTLGQSLVAAGTNTVANEAPIDAAYAQALQTFSSTLLGIQFPSAAGSDVRTLVNAVTAVRTDLAGVASGAVSTTQFVSDESNLQAAINVVQRDLGLGLSTPIAGG